MSCISVIIFNKKYFSSQGELYYIDISGNVYKYVYSK